MITNEMRVLHATLVPKCKKLLALANNAKRYRDMQIYDGDLYYKYNFIYVQLLTEFNSLRNTLHNEVYSNLECDEWFE